MLLVTILLAVAPQAAVGQLAAPEVKSVSFEGNETFPADSLARAIATRKTECRSWVFYFPIPLCPLGVGLALSKSQLRDRDLPRDRARLVLWYRQRGFRDVQVDTAIVVQTATTAEVTFRIVEGPPVIADSIVFQGVDDLPVPDLLEDLPIAEGDRLSTIVLDATRDTITRRLADQGYAYAEVLRNALRPVDDPLSAIVTFDVVSGPATTYGDITVEGTQHLAVGTVLRTIQLNSGDPYSRTDVDDARSRLYGLEIVRNASVVPDTVDFSRDPRVDVAVTLQEGDPYRVRAGAGWSNADCLTAEARWTARNFLGGGRLLGVRGRVGNILAEEAGDVLCRQSGEDEFAKLTGLASVDFVQPWIFSTRNALSASVFVERQSLPDVFIREAMGIQLGLSRTIAAQTILTGFYRPELSRLEEAKDVLFCTGFLVCSPEDIEALKGTNWLAPVGLNLTRNRSNDLLNPRSGYRLLFDVEHAASWTGSDFRYDRIVVEGSRYVGVGRSVFATRLRGGWVGAAGFTGVSAAGNSGAAEIAPQKRFYTGGANSVRGFAQSRLGPRVLFSEPETLLSESGGCTPEELEGPVFTCVPDTEDALDPQPTGGTRLIEANAEMRFPIAAQFEGVVFVDAGQAWGVGESITFSSMEFTPGVGIRLPSPVGPIRLDVAYRFRGGQDLPVVSERIRPYDPTMGDVNEDRLEVDGGNGLQPIDWVSTGELVFLNDPFLFGVNDQGLQFHISIGQAF
jgi:outer membrane protein insertion porin family